MKQCCKNDYFIFLSMRYSWFFLLLTTLPLSITAQELIEKPPVNTDFEMETGMSVYGARYPVGVNGEVSKNLYVNYQISRRLHLQLQHFYDKFGTHERTNSSFLIKYHLNRKLYLFAGPEVEYDINQVTGEGELIQTNLNIGMGYKINPNLLLELGYHRNMSDQQEEFYSVRNVQSAFSFRARF